jgi:hypothetical protein
MIESHIRDNIKTKEVPFPKLMRGLRTGTIYLAILKRNSVYGPQIHTIVMAVGNSLHKVGDRAIYSSEWLEDFHGEITLRNRNA